MQHIKGKTVGAGVNSPMNTLHVKAEIQQSIGSMLSKSEDNYFHVSNEIGSFNCSIENHDHFTILHRTFETGADGLLIPFSSYEPSVQMIFSLNGESFFNRQSDPFMMKKSSHCINFFKRYDCTNLLDEHARQEDITFRLSRQFYSDLIAQYLSSAEDRLPEMIAREIEFNTINDHRPIDAALMGILQNIVNCPFEGSMKQVFLREHIRALLTLQLFHFNEVVHGKPARLDSHLSKADREKLYAVKSHIDENFLNPTTLETLSRNFGLNEFKLKSGFRNLFDTSPIRYLQTRRLSYALELLKDTDKSIKEIAQRIGYTHAGNFTTAFARAFGNAPQYYRKEKNR